MNLKNIFLSLLFIATSLTLTAGDTINGAGATFPYPVYSAWAFNYYRATGVKLNYQSIGSGGGVRQIKNRTVDFGASDAPVKPAELKAGNFLQFPAIIGGVVPVVNVKGLKAGQLKLTGEALADIFLGEIKKWNDPRIEAINRGLTLPDSEITVVHRSDGSGTTAIFSTYLSVCSGDWSRKVGKGKSVNWPVGIGGKGNEGVANYVKRVNNSIGYVEFAYAKQSKMTYVKLKNKSGRFVEPSFEAFKDAAAGAKWNPDTGYYLWLVDAPGDGSWPIAGASFILLGKEKPGVNRRVVKFFEWAFKNGDATAEKLIYVPLPKLLKSSIQDYWKKNGID
ncbi:MAG: phosphate ABC transporter substrate-binding protein PstS [Acidobacteria bacterium]|nr:MAG: phosphate ABC transporter substrate-binding protein PstS [Acidobacteriota bacterium]RLE22195.1 MAG: phosphate ABC transporter substrate-binding protein PstS [Acidobacteriota bacterium]